VQGHANDRCLNGVVIVPGTELQAQKALDAFLVGRLRVTMKGYRDKLFGVAWGDILRSNLGINLCALPPNGVELCNCEWTRNA